MFVYSIQHGKCHFKTAEGHDYFYIAVTWYGNFKLFYEAFNTCQSGAINQSRAGEKLSEKLQRETPAANVLNTAFLDLTMSQKAK